ncbi:MAG: DPP IV N-terminal domain-containing protein [Anaerolineales bacterium]
MPNSKINIPIEEVAKYPRPGMAIPSNLTFSPDDAWIAYLHSAEGTLTQQLFVFDPETREARVLIAPEEAGETEATLSAEEKLRRERARTLALGVTRYAWGKGQRLLAPINGELYVQDGIEGSLRKLVGKEAGPVIDPRFSPDGEQIAYVQGGALYVVPSVGRNGIPTSPQALTTPPEGRAHGLAEYIAQEEMARARGFWWSQDSAALAFVEVDETHIPPYRIMHQGQDATGEAAEEVHRYPFAGAANANVRLGVISAAGGPIRWMDLGEDEDIYLARVKWLPDGDLTAQVQNRAQDELRLLRLDPQTGAARVLLTETSDVWINLHRLFRPLKAGGFLWGSERDGFMHLYHYDAMGALVRQLTSGAWMVEAVEGVDEDAGKVYVTGTRDHPTEQHLYEVPLAGGEARRLTHGPGTHEVVLDHACERFIDVYSELDLPPMVMLRSLHTEKPGGETICPIYEARDPRIDAMGLKPPGLVEFESRDGATLYGAVYVPDDAEFGPGPYPTIVSVYGGPHAQLVRYSWGLTVDMRAQYLRSLGFLVFKLDNRGSARRGLTFEGAIRHRMGTVEVEDQVDGVRWLVAQGLADPARVGIYGWSYGGYMALMCLAQAPETFHVAVAGAPVTDWAGYDTHYTERYMSTPTRNPEGYRTGSVMTHVEKITGDLLLVHGLIDENVHFRHTARLINALIRARKKYDLLLFPDERHVPRHEKDRIYMEERIRDYFLEHLMHRDG